MLHFPPNVDRVRGESFGGIWQNPQGVPFNVDFLSEEQKRTLVSGLPGESGDDAAARRLVDYLRGGIDAWAREVDDSVKRDRLA